MQKTHTETNHQTSAYAERAKQLVDLARVFGAVVVLAFLVTLYAASVEKHESTSPTPKIPYLLEVGVEMNAAQTNVAPRKSDFDRDYKLAIFFPGEESSAMPKLLSEYLIEHGKPDIEQFMTIPIAQRESYKESVLDTKGPWVLVRQEFKFTTTDYTPNYFILNLVTLEMYGCPGSSDYELKALITDTHVIRLYNQSNDFFAPPDSIAVNDIKGSGQDFYPVQHDNPDTINTEHLKMDLGPDGQGVYLLGTELRDTPTVHEWNIASLRNWDSDPVSLINGTISYLNFTTGKWQRVYTAEAGWILRDFQASPDGNWLSIYAVKTGRTGASKHIITAVPQFDKKNADQLPDLPTQTQLKRGSTPLVWNNHHLVILHQSAEHSEVAELNPQTGETKTLCTLPPGRLYVGRKSTDTKAFVEGNILDETERFVVGRTIYVVDTTAVSATAEDPEKNCQRSISITTDDVPVTPTPHPPL